MKQMIASSGCALILVSIVVVAAVPAGETEIEQGRKVYAEKRCAMCHAIGGQGGKIGPDISNVGNERDGDWPKKFLQDPKGTVPKAKMMPVKATDEELAALVDYLLSLKQ